MPGFAMELTNSKRLLYTGSYVSTHLTPDERKRQSASPGAAVRKANLIRALDVRPDRIGALVEAVRPESVDGHRRHDVETLLRVARQIASVPSTLNTDVAPELATIPEDTVFAFAKLTVESKVSSVGKFLLDLYEHQQSISPIGRIHLERIEMFPVGVEKGELVFTVPMAPGETVTISHKEWSTSTREFEEIVQDYFESYSERGVAEKTDASMASENEVVHANAFSFGASLSGGYAGVTLTTTVGLQTSTQERQSVKNSMQRSREVTEKASARSRKEHKISVKLEEKKGSADSSFRTITNPDAVARRVDYYRMMRKWRTDLYRYGLRLTYDIAIPTPGVRLWAQHQRILEIERIVRTPFVYGYKAEDIHPGNYQSEAAKYKTVVDTEPLYFVEQKIYGGFDFLDADAAAITRFGRLDFDVPAGYVLDRADFVADMAVWPGEPVVFRVLNAEPSPPPVPNAGPVQVTSELPEHLNKYGHLAVTYAYAFVSTASITLSLKFRRTKETYEAWQRNVHRAIRAAAEARHAEEMARLSEERDRLWRMLHGKDTLSLRRLEREELLRLVMQWLMGPSYPLTATPEVAQTLATLDSNERAFRTAATPPLSPTFANLSDKAWSQALVFGELVKFVHQAVEWESLLYFLYPYFWGSETVGRDKLLFEHGDAEHQRFLRAGYARVVLPVRPGFEEDFTRLIETGSLSGNLSSPYLPIANEIANFARTNYAGIPPANPEKHARPLLYPEQRRTWDVMQDTFAKLDAYRAANGKYPATLADLPGGAPKDAWNRDFEYSTPGLGADYDMVSLGADGQPGGEGLDADISSAAGASLVATWFDYTPTSALDIEVDTKPGDIA